MAFPWAPVLAVLVACGCLSPWSARAQETITPRVMPISNNDCYPGLLEGSMLPDIEAAGFPAADAEWLTGLAQDWQRLLKRKSPEWSEQVRVAVETSRADLMKVAVYRRLLQQIRPTLGRMSAAYRPSAELLLQVDLASQFEKFGVYGLMMHPRAELLTQLELSTQQEPGQREAAFELYLAKIFALLANRVYDAFAVTADGAGFAARTASDSTATYSPAETAARQKFAETVPSPLGAFDDIAAVAFNGTVQGDSGYTSMSHVDTAECVICGSRVFQDLSAERGIMARLESYHEAMVSADFLLAQYIQSTADVSPGSNTELLTAAPGDDGPDPEAATPTNHPAEVPVPVAQIIPSPAPMDTLSRPSSDGVSPCKTLGFDRETWQPDLTPIVFPEGLRPSVENVTAAHDWSAKVAAAKSEQQDLQGLLSGIVQQSSVQLFSQEAYARLLQQTVALHRHAADLAAQMALDAASWQSSPTADGDIFGSFQAAALITLVVTHNPSLGSFSFASSPSEFDTFTIDAIEKMREGIQADLLPPTGPDHRGPDVAGHLQEVAHSLKEAAEAVQGQTPALVYTALQFQGDMSTFDVESCEAPRGKGPVACSLCTDSSLATQQFGGHFATFDEIIGRYHMTVEAVAQAMSEAVNSYLELMQDAEAGVSPTPEAHTGAPDDAGPVVTESPGLVPPPAPLSSLSAPECPELSLVGKQWEVDSAGILPESLMESVVNLTRDRGWAERVSIAQEAGLSVQDFLAGIIQQSSDRLVRVEAYERFLSQTLVTFELVARLRAKLAHSPYAALEPPVDFHKIALILVVLHHGGLTTESSGFDSFVGEAVDMLVGYYVESQMQSGQFYADVEGPFDVTSLLEEIKNLQGVYVTQLAKVMADGARDSSAFEVRQCTEFRKGTSCAMCANLEAASDQYGGVFDGLDSLVMHYHDALEMKVVRITEQVDAYLLAQPTTAGDPPPQRGPRCAKTAYTSDWEVVTEGDPYLSQSARWLSGNFSEILSLTTAPIRGSSVFRQTPVRDVIDAVLLAQPADPAKVFAASSLADEVVHRVTSSWREVLKLATTLGDPSVATGGVASGGTDLLTASGGESVMPPLGLVANFGMPASLFFIKPDTVQRLNHMYSTELAEVSASPALALLDPLNSDHPDHLDSYLYTLTREVLSACEQRRKESPGATAVDDGIGLAFEELFGHLQIGEHLAAALRAVDDMWPDAPATDAATPAYVTVECTRSWSVEPVTDCSVCWRPEADALRAGVADATRPAMERLRELLQQRSDLLMSYLMPAVATESSDGERPKAVTEGENLNGGDEATREPGVGGETPDTGGENPDTGGENPDTGGENPDTGGETPDTGGENPDTGGETPDTGGETPDTGGENPDTGGENPDTGGENPDTGSENPDTGGENPDTGGENPDTGGENPDTGGENPDTGGENPDTGGENPDTGGENPDTGGENPDTGGENPDTGGENPDTGGENPDTGGENPDTGGENPDTGGETPDTGGENPDTGGENPDTGGENPDTGGENPDTGGENPDTGGENPDTGGENPDTGGENPDTGGENPDTGGENPDTGGETPKVVAIISGPNEIPYCGTLLVHGSASRGADLTYTWAMDSRQGTSETLNARLRAVNDNNYSDLKLTADLLAVGVPYTVTLTVSAEGARPSTTTHTVEKLSEEVMKPGLVIAHRGLDQDNVVLASKRFVMWAEVQFYSRCIESSSVEFIWTAATQRRTITGVLNRSGRNQRIWAHDLPIGEPITITVTIPANGETVLVPTTASVTVTVRQSPLVAAVQGGSRVTVGRDSAEQLSLDASESHDPDDVEATLRFSWSCTRDGGASSECNGLTSALDMPVLYVNPSSLSVGTYTFAVTVRRYVGEGEASARVVVEVEDGNPPQIELTAPFRGMFRPSSRVAVNANIRNAMLVDSVEWRVSKDGAAQSVAGASTGFVKKSNTASASFGLPAGALSGGSEYTIEAIAKDLGGRTLSSGAIPITVHRGVTGCVLQFLSWEYRVFELLDINVVNCVGEGHLTYKAYVASTADSEDRQLLTTSASDKSRMDQLRAVEVPGARTVAVIVKVCDETGSCQEVSEGGITQRKEATEQGIEAVKLTRLESVQRGDYVGALHKNGMLVKYGAQDGTARRRRRRSAYTEAVAMHHEYFRNATTDFSNLDVSQWDSVALELDSFAVEEIAAKLDAVSNIERMLASYLDLGPEEFEEEARDSILKKIGELLADLRPDTVDSRALIRKCRTMIGQVTAHVGRGLVEGDSVTTVTGCSTVHLQRLTLQSSRPVQAGTIQIRFPQSLPHIGTSVTLNVEEFDDAVDYNSDNGMQQALTSPICSVALQDALGMALDVSDLPYPIEITIPTPSVKCICLHYDVEEAMWSKTGLTTKQERAGDDIVCETTHLTDFATAVDLNNGGVLDPNNGLPVPVGGLTVAAVAGIIVGVLALLVIVTLIVFLVLKVSKGKKVNPKD